MVPCAIPQHRALQNQMSRFGLAKQHYGHKQRGPRFSGESCVNEMGREAKTKQVRKMVGQTACVGTLPTAQKSSPYLWCFYCCSWLNSLAASLKVSAELQIGKSLKRCISNELIPNTITFTLWQIHGRSIFSTNAYR